MQEIVITYYNRKEENQERNIFELNSAETLRVLEEKFKDYEISRYPEGDEYINLKIVQQVNKNSSTNLAQPAYFKNYDKQIAKEIFTFLRKNENAPTP